LHLVKNVLLARVLENRGKSWIGQPLEPSPRSFSSRCDGQR